VVENGTGPERCAARVAVNSPFGKSPALQAHLYYSLDQLANDLVYRMSTELKESGNGYQRRRRRGQRVGVASHEAIRRASKRQYKILSGSRHFGVVEMY
jgi:hypothetical protein